MTSNASFSQRSSVVRACGDRLQTAGPWAVGRVVSSAASRGHTPSSLPAIRDLRPAARSVALRALRASIHQNNDAFFFEKKLAFLLEKTIFSKTNYSSLGT